MVCSDNDIKESHKEPQRLKQTYRHPHSSGYTSGIKLSMTKCKDVCVCLYVSGGGVGKVMKGTVMYV